MRTWKKEDPKPLGYNALYSCGHFLVYRIGRNWLWSDGMSDPHGLFKTKNHAQFAAEFAMGPEDPLTQLKDFCKEAENYHHDGYGVPCHWAEGFDCGMHEAAERVRSILNSLIRSER